MTTKSNLRDDEKLTIGEKISEYAFVGSAVVAIIPIWFFVKTCRRLSQEYFSKKNEGK